MTTKKTTTTTTQLSFYIDTDELDPNDVVPNVPEVGKCAAVYVSTLREVGMLQLTADHVLDVLESFATHAEDSMLPTAAATFRARALTLKSTFVNSTITEILTALSQGSVEPGAYARARTTLAAAKTFVEREYVIAVHLAEVFNLDPSYTSGEDDEEEPEDDETED